MKRIFNDTMDCFLIKNYNLFGSKKCAEHLNLKPKQILSRVNYLRKLGKISGFLDKQTLFNVCSEAMKREDKLPNEYGVNPLQFEFVKSAKVAYLLGLLWADGCVYIKEFKYKKNINYKHTVHWVMLNLVKEDFIKIEHIINSTGDWNFYTVKKKKGREQRMARITNKYLALYLKKYNFCDKSKTASILDTIPRELWPFWFRGFLDGDGCISFKKQYCMYLCGPIDQDWMYLTSLLDELGCKYKIKKVITKYGSRSYVNICNLPSMVIFGKYIFKGKETDGIGLDRKYLNFKKIEDKFKSSKRYSSQLKLKIL